MKLLDNIIKIFYHPFTHNPEDFKIKFKSTYYSDLYCNVLYTANGGITWKYIYYCQEPVFSYDDYYLRKETYNINEDYYIKKSKQAFTSYQRVLDYQKEEINNVKIKNETLYQERKDKKEQIKQNYINANK